MWPDTDNSNEHSKQANEMKQPHPTIKLMAKCLRRRVVDIEEYLEDKEEYLDPKQQKHLKHMINNMLDNSTA